LIIVNFDRTKILTEKINLPNEVLKIKASVPVTELLSGKKLNIPSVASIQVKVSPASAQIIEF
jgi:hypothetical protein